MIIVILFLRKEYQITCVRRSVKSSTNFKSIHMEYIIQSPNIVVSGKKEEIIRNKFSWFEKKLQGLIRCDIVLRKVKSGEQESFVVDGRLVIPGNDLFASEQGPSFEIATDKVCVDLKNQIRKQKEMKNKRLIKPVDQYIRDKDHE